MVSWSRWGCDSCGCTAEVNARKLSGMARRRVKDRDYYLGKVIYSEPAASGGDFAWQRDDGVFWHASTRKAAISRAKRHIRASRRRGVMDNPVTGRTVWLAGIAGAA